MTPFETLSQEEQVARLEVLARAALARFAVEPESLAPLVHAENTTFKVVSAGETYCVRIHRTDYQNFESIQSELEWLSALRRETDLQVPNPVRTPSGDLVVVEEADGVPEARNVVLFRWMEGEPVWNSYGPDQARTIGTLMARLHIHGREWSKPTGFRRHRLDEHGIYAPKTDWPLAEPHRFLTEERREFVNRIAEESRSAMRALGTGSDVYGLMHADLHQGNVLVDGDAYKIIDFDDCGTGHYVYDIAAAIAFRVENEDFTAVRDALYEGYETVAPLPPGTRELLPTFLRMRFYALIRWMIDRSHTNAKMRDNGHKYVDYYLGSIEMTYAL